MFLGAWGTRYYKYDWFGFVPTCSGTRVITAPTTTVDPDALAQAIAKKMPPPAPPIVDVDQLAQKITAKLPSECPDVSKCLAVADNVVATSAKLSAIATALSERPTAEPSSGCGSTHETTRVEATRAPADGEYCPALKPCNPFDSASKVKACLNDLKEIGEHYKALSERAQALHEQGRKAIDVRPY